MIQCCCFSFTCFTFFCLKKKQHSYFKKEAFWSVWIKLNKKKKRNWEKNWSFFWTKGYSLWFIFRHFLLPSGTLQVVDVSGEDEGEYRCTATQGELHKLPDQVENLPWKKSSAASLRVIPGNSRSHLMFLLCQGLCVVMLFITLQGDRWTSLPPDGTVSLLYQGQCSVW